MGCLYIYRLDSVKLTHLFTGLLKSLLCDKELLLILNSFGTIIYTVVYTAVNHALDVNLNLFWGEITMILHSNNN